MNTLLTLREVIGDKKKGIPALIPVSRSTWYQGIKDGIFPKPWRTKPGGRTFWHINVIKKFIEDMEKGSDDGTR